MSDDMPHQAGSRRRRREIREARERAQAEQQGAPQRHTSHGSVSPGSAESAGRPVPQVPFEEAIGAVSPDPAPDVPLEDHGPPGPQDAAAERPVEQPEFEDPLGPEEYIAEERVEHDADGTPLLITSSSYGRGYQTVTPVATGASREILTRRQERRRRRNIALGLVIGGFAVLLVIFAVVFNAVFGGLLAEPEDYETQAGDTVSFEVNPGEGWAVVANRLAEEGIIASSEALDAALREAEDLGVLQPGEYEVREEMPASDAIMALTESEAGGYLAINRGWTVDQMLEEMEAANTGFTEEEFREAAQDPTEFGLPEEATSLEGYLAAGEYRFSYGAEPEEVIQMMVDRTFEQLEEAGITDEDEQWRTVIIASLITGEANHQERGDGERERDYRLMAGAIENRLAPDNTETNRLLQIDATVNYGLGLTGDLHFPEDERLNPDNEYNTYVHEGLPPGPIAAPAAGTLEAAADPIDTDYYYWVTVNVETGETRFNETRADHEADVEVFRQYCDDNPGVCSPAEEEAADAEVEEG
ncbi:endolytic transglycosylase MltG [Nesterenkonia suensis]